MEDDSMHLRTIVSFRLCSHYRITNVTHFGSQCVKVKILEAQFGPLCLRKFMEKNQWILLPRYVFTGYRSHLWMLHWCFFLSLSPSWQLSPLIYGWRHRTVPAVQECSRTSRWDTANEQAIAFWAVLLDSVDNCREKVVLLKFWMNVGSDSKYVHRINIHKNSLPI